MSASPSSPLYRNRSKHRRHRSHGHHHNHCQKGNLTGIHHVGVDRSKGSRKRKFDFSGKCKSEAPDPKGLGDLPPELVIKIAAAFDIPTLRAASSTCRSWWEGLRPLREAMLLLLWGKRFKKGGQASSGQVGYAIRRDPEKALQSFLKAAALGSALAMVDAGLLLWEMGRKEEGKEMYRKAAELGHPAGQHNLAVAYLEDGHTRFEEAVKLLFQAAKSGYTRAQYSLALCLHHGRGVECNKAEAVKWYRRAAEGGNARAMYNISLCYSLGEVLLEDRQQAKVWLKRAADNGHQKAQMELATQLISSGHFNRALFYLELAAKAGETTAVSAIEEVRRNIN